MKQPDAPVKMRPYSTLAYIYDAVMEHVNYAQWARYIKSLFHFANRPVKVLADLSCGTGNLLRFFNQRRLDTFGLDLSLAMLEMTRRKLPSTPLICADFKNLPLKNNSVDVALSLYDSVNYLLTDQEVVAFFNACHRILRPGGLLIFDIVTPELCRTTFRYYQEDRTLNPNCAYERTSFFQEADNLQINRFRIQLNGNTFFEEHRQRIREVQEWVRLIRQTPFKIEEIFSNFSTKPVHPHSERAHFILKR